MASQATLCVHPVGFPTALLSHDVLEHGKQLMVSALVCTTVSRGREDRWRCTAPHQVPCPPRRMGQGVHIQRSAPLPGLRRVGSIRLVGQMSHSSLCQGLASHALERGARSTPPHLCWGSSGLASRCSNKIPCLTWVSRLQQLGSVPIQLHPSFKKVTHFLADISTARKGVSIIPEPVQLRPADKTDYLFLGSQTPPCCCPGVCEHQAKPPGLKGQLQAGICRRSACGLDRLRSFGGARIAAVMLGKMAPLKTYGRNTGRCSDQILAVAPELAPCPGQEH